MTSRLKACVYMSLERRHEHSAITLEIQCRFSFNTLLYTQAENSQH